LLSRIQILFRAWLISANRLLAMTDAGGLLEYVVDKGLQQPLKTLSKKSAFCVTSSAYFFFTSSCDRRLAALYVNIAAVTGVIYSGNDRYRYLKSFRALSSTPCRKTGSPGAG
jgi:hypothetical protein